MGSYLYCVVPTGHAPAAALDGLEAASVEVLEAEGIAGWYSRLPEPPAPSLENIRRHDEVVRAAATDSTTPLPARFGQWFADAAALRARLAADAAAFESVLGTLAGATEFGVVVPSGDAAGVPGRAVAAAHERPAREAAPASEGRQYLRAIADRLDRARREDERAEGLLDELEDVVAPFVRDARRTPPGAASGRNGRSSRPDRAARVAHLVPNGRVDEYVASVGDFERRHGDAGITLVGPFPPYSFAP